MKNPDYNSHVSEEEVAAHDFLMEMPQNIPLRNISYQDADLYFGSGRDNFWFENDEHQKRN